MNSHNPGKGLHVPSVLTYLLLVIALAMGVLWLIPANYYMVFPGQAQRVSEMISAPGHHAPPTTGGLYDTYVSQFKATRLLYVLFGLVRSDVTVEPAGDVNQGCSDIQYQRLLFGMMSDSKVQAEAAALHVLGYKVGIDRSSPQVVQVLCGVPASAELQPGDRIVAVDGHRVHIATEVAPYISRHQPGSVVKLTIDRNGKRRTIGVRTVHADSAGNIVGHGGHALVGILTSNPLRFPVKVHIDSGDVGGPSAGLMFALGIVQQLSEHDITHDNKVAGTGTIDARGNVGPIGAARQKALAAQAAGARYFFVPVDNYAEARSAHTDLKIVPVRTIKQAIDFLNRLKQPASNSKT